MIYCLKDPHGRLIELTASQYRSECWIWSFEFIAKIEGEDWRNRYWHREDASQQWAKRHGYRIVRCVLKEAKE